MTKTRYHILILWAFFSNMSAAQDPTNIQALHSTQSQIVDQLLKDESHEFNATFGTGPKVLAGFLGFVGGIALFRNFATLQSGNTSILALITLFSSPFIKKLVQYKLIQKMAETKKALIKSYNHTNGISDTDRALIKTYMHYLTYQKIIDLITSIIQGTSGALFLRYPVDKIAPKIADKEFKTLLLGVLGKSNHINAG